MQSLWELKPDLSEIRGASNYWHVQTEPPQEVSILLCVKRGHKSLEQASILANQIGADQDLLARWLRLSSHEIMVTSSRSSSGHAGFALFSTLGKNAAPGMAKNEDKRQTKNRVAQVALRHRRLAASHSVLGRYRHLVSPPSAKMPSGGGRITFTKMTLFQGAKQ